LAYRVGCRWTCSAVAITDIVVFGRAEPG
jgi:hypothetical protein